MNVGTISVGFGADASTLLATQDAIRKALGGTSKAAEDLGRVLGRTASAGDALERNGKKIASGADQAAASLHRLTPAAAAAQSKIASLQATAQTAAPKLSAMAAAVSGVSSAMGTAGGKIGGAIQGLAASAMAFAVGGPLVAGIVALGVVLGGVVGHFSDLDAAAKAASEKAASYVTALKTEVKDLGDELRKLQVGGDRSALELQGQKVVAAAAEADPAVTAFGGRAKFDRFVQYEKSGTNIGPLINLSKDAWTELKKAVDKADTELSKLAAIKRIQDEQKDQREADAGVDAANLQEQRFQDRRKAAAPLVQSEKSERWMRLSMGSETNYGQLQSTAFNAASGSFKPDISLMDPDATRSAALSRGGEQYVQAEAEFARLSDPLEGSITVISQAMDATSDEIAAMNSDFMSAGEAAIDLRTPLERFGDALNDIDLKAFGMEVAEATLRGGFSAGGAAAGSTVGAVVDVATGGATGGLGAVIGGIIGGVLGNALDELINVLGILTPLFDAVAVIISALAPIFVVLGVFVTSLAGTIIALVPLIAAVAEPIAAILLVVVRLVSAILPFINILVIAVGALVAFILEPIMIGAQKLDEGLRLMVSGALWLYNGFVDVYNALIDLIRKLPGAGEFGVKMNQISTYVEDVIGGFGKSLDDITDVMDGAAEATESYGASQENVPTGYRVPFYDAETPNGPGNGIDRPSRVQQFIINGGLTLLANDPDIERAIRQRLLRQRGVNQGRSGGRDESN